MLKKYNGCFWYKNDVNTGEDNNAFISQNHVCVIVKAKEFYFLEANCMRTFRPLIHSLCRFQTVLARSCIHSNYHKLYLSSAFVLKSIIVSHQGSNTIWHLKSRKNWKYSGKARDLECRIKIIPSVRSINNSVIKNSKNVLQN